VKHYLLTFIVALFVVPFSPAEEPIKLPAVFIGWAIEHGKQGNG
jgi:hypothetical protein